ncbi:MAG: PIG-L family deacetylase [Candidatus Sumerlaeota bacterium]|nr:PIG-L family deacetylase [Candidatus Sumerlaeota bacterium]
MNRNPNQPANRPDGILDLIDRGKSLMLVSAHPDDETIVGALLARAAERSRACVACLTNGEGGRNLVAPVYDAELAEIRAKELTEACAVLGAELFLLGFWNGLPGGVRNPANARETPEEAIARWRRSGRDPLAEIVCVIRRWKPDILVTFDPDQGFTMHKEHRAASILTAQAFRGAGELENRKPGKPGDRRASPNRRRSEPAPGFPERQARPPSSGEASQSPVSPWRPERLYYMVNRHAKQRDETIPEVDPSRITEIVRTDSLSAKRGKTYHQIALEAWSRHATQFGPDPLNNPEWRPRVQREVNEIALILAATTKPRGA